MKKVIILILSLVQIIQGYSQHSSTTDLYTNAIDVVLKENDLDKNGDLKLILAPQFYENNIKTYKGKHKLKYISGFRDAKKEWAGKELVYLDLSPLKISKGELFIIVKKSTITYTSKKRWKLNNENQKFYYTIYEYDKQKKEYKLKDISHGKLCPDTVN